MADKELQWSPEFLNRIRAGFSDEEWYSAWIETWDSRGGSGRIALDARPEDIEAMEETERRLRERLQTEASKLAPCPVDERENIK